MTQSNQSEQTLAEFRAIADWWDESSTSESTYSVIRHRNSIVLDCANQRSAGSFLDIGCGTGQLTLDVGLLCFRH